jgi:hypothetical protein
MATILDPNSGGSPPKSLASGSWPTAMRTGKWTFQWTPAIASSAYAATDEWVWFEFGESDDAVYFNKTAGAATLRIWHGGGIAFTTPFSFAAGATLTITIDTPSDQVTIAGATTGNGTFNGAWGAFSTGDGSLDIGQYHTGIQQIGGTFGLVTDDTASGNTLAMAGTLAELSGSAAVQLGSTIALAGSLAGLTGAAAVDVSNGPTIALAGSLAGLTGAAALELHPVITLAGSLAGLTGAAAMSVSANSTLALAGALAGLEGALTMLAAEYRAPPPSGGFAPPSETSDPNRSGRYRDTASTPDSGGFAGITYYSPPGGT